MVKRQTRPPHPGWACCDPDQDLAGWLDRERARSMRLREQAKAVRVLAAEADGRALRELSADVENARRVLHGEANALVQSAMIIEGHTERVRATHFWRLPDSGT